MHIPSSMMDGAVCPVTAAVSVTGVSLAAVLAWKSAEKPTSLRFAAVSALVFAGQMVNFPVMSGTSGHLLGGVLAAALLGMPFGVLSMALVLTLQCLVFSDGGFSVLGANILNMAVLGAGVGGWILQRMATTSNRCPAAPAAVAAWCSVMIAALACSFELAASGTIPFSKVAPAMLGIHALIALGEAAITAAVISLLTLPVLQASSRRPTFLLSVSAFIIALVMAPFACTWPDGLESVAGTLRFLHASAPSFAAPLPDYSFPLVSNGVLATSLAGGTGVALTFLTAWCAASIWRKAAALGIR